MLHPVSFLSDFGLVDEFVGVVHGVIARIAPGVAVHDITHGIPPGDVRAGALTLLRAVQYMPEGVALAVVDPGVGTDRAAIAARTPWGHFVGPDNGILAPAVAMVGGADRVVSIEEPAFRIPSEGTTFAGRDLFAPAAAVLAGGQAGIDELGPPLERVTPLMLPLVEAGPGGAVGEILWIDHFGNAQTNITPDDLAAAGLTVGDEIELVVGSARHRLPWVGVYGDVGPGDALVHVDSYGQVAIAVRGGRADEELALATRLAVTVRTPGGGPAPLEITAP